MTRTLLLLIALIASTPPLLAQPRVLLQDMKHLRLGEKPEWSDFTAATDGASLKLTFAAEVNAAEATLCLRQLDVREPWKVLLNGVQIGKLQQDENDMATCFAVPPQSLKAEGNTLVIEQASKVVDDIHVGAITLDLRPTLTVLSEVSVAIDVHEGKELVPCRITVLNAAGSLAPLRLTGDEPQAARTGVVYSGNGRARFTLPAGQYTFLAGRGFEYSTMQLQGRFAAGETAKTTMEIVRDVRTSGWVSCDPHVHTLTHSGHGDCTLDERMVTLAGEGIELPIATDHNKQVDYEKAAVKMGVRRHFTPVVGNEVTTPVGHFNLFPLPLDQPAPEFKHKDWASVFQAIDKSGAKAIILNHARDLHSAFRPFGLKRHIAVAGEDLDGWVLQANAMEIVNSGAQQTDVMQLTHDWLGMLNAGRFLTPVGSSDSHDVSRYIVGQGRTYIRCGDKAPGELNVAEAIDSFCRGRVSVSCGLLTEITVNGSSGPGDIAPPAKQVVVAVQVLGPSWTKADRVELFANGIKIREERVDDQRFPRGTHAMCRWTLDAPRHDVHYVAVASGPGFRKLSWPIARPYQPTSPVDRPRVIGITGAVWYDGDGDGKRTSAADIARGVVKSIDNVAALAKYDEAVAVQAAAILRKRGVLPTDPKLMDAARAAGPHVQRGFETYAEAWRASEVARLEK